MTRFTKSYWLGGHCCILPRRDWAYTTVTPMGGACQVFVAGRGSRYQPRDALIYARAYQPIHLFQKDRATA